MSDADSLHEERIAALAWTVQAAWASPDQPRAVLEAAGAAFKATVGYKFYSVLQTLPGEKEVKRIYTTGPDIYPVGGRKPIVADAYSARVRGEKKPFLGRTMTEIAPLFTDHETLSRLGLGSVMNLPIVFRGKVLGTVNLLDGEGRYHEGCIDPAMTIARQVLPVLINQYQ